MAEKRGCTVDGEKERLEGYIQSLRKEKAFREEQIEAARLACQECDYLQQVYERRLALMGKVKSDG